MPPPASSSDPLLAEKYSPLRKMLYAAPETLKPNVKAKAYADMFQLGAAVVEFIAGWALLKKLQNAPLCLCRVHVDSAARRWRTCRAVMAIAVQLLHDEPRKRLDAAQCHDAFAALV